MQIRESSVNEPPLPRTAESDNLNTGHSPAGGTREEDVFFLFRTGPLHRLLQRLHLGESPAKVLARRVALIVGVAWIPVLCFCALGDTAGFYSFLSAVGLHARLLLALPLLLFGEAYANKLTARVLQQCLLSGVVDAQSRKRFERLLSDAKRVAGSTIGELVVLLVVLFASGSMWSLPVDGQVEEWYGRVSNDNLQFNLAGLWARHIALPLFQFILLRWIYHLFIWLVLVFRISRMPLQIIPLHPDRRGGLSFMADSIRATVPVLLAVSALMAGTIAERMLRYGEALVMFKSELLMIGGCALALTLGPLLFFMAPMSRARWKELHRYGPFAGEYVRDFGRKWLNTPPQPNTERLGSSDIQSLADLANSYQVVDNMSPVPFGMREIVTVLVCIYILVLPLLLTVFPASEILSRLLGILL